MAKYIQFLNDLIVNLTENGCILINTKTSILYELKKENIELFKKIYSGYPIDEFMDNKKSKNDFIEQILQSKIGYVTDNKPFNEPFSLGNSFFDVEGLVAIRSVFIELPFECQENCDFCNKINLFCCEKCHRSNKLNLEYNIDALRELKCETITFMAGDISGKVEEFEKIFNQFKKIKPNCEFELVCYKNSIQNKKLYDICLHENLKLIVNVKISDVDKKWIEMLSYWGMEKIQINYIMTYEQYVADFNNVKIPNWPYTYSLCVADKKVDFLKFQYTIDPFYVNAAKHYNPCLLSKIFVRANGDIVPCKGLIDISVGKVEKDKISINQNALRKIWESSPTSIQGCKNCPYNIICKECRGLDYRMTNKIEGKTTCMQLEGK